ncbi:MAG TPA: hypothetical protein VL995_09635 [Cellvibrio sp.]|nr:hypothetical protein [Cellvibrio sp.]
MKKESRNGHAFHPIMRKGGVHEKTNKAKRAMDRQQTARKVNDYFAKRNKKAGEDSPALSA